MQHSFTRSVAGPLLTMLSIGLSTNAYAAPHCPAQFEYEGIVASIAREYQLDEAIVVAAVATESGFCPTAVSSAGAQGMFQIMPDTARGLGLCDPFDPIANLRAGTYYLKQQYDRFGRYDLALAAYNAGPGNVAKYGGIPPFTETKNHVLRVMARANALRHGIGIREVTFNDVAQLNAMTAARQSRPQAGTGLTQLGSVSVARVPANNTPGLQRTAGGAAPVTTAPTPTVPQPVTTPAAITVAAPVSVPVTIPPSALPTPTPKQVYAPTVTSWPPTPVATAQAPTQPAANTTPVMTTGTPFATTPPGHTPERSVTVIRPNTTQSAASNTTPTTPTPPESDEPTTAEPPQHADTTAPTLPSPRGMTLIRP